MCSLMLPDLKTPWSPASHALHLLPRPPGPWDRAPAPDLFGFFPGPLSPYCLKAELPSEFWPSASYRPSRRH